MSKWVVWAVAMLFVLGLGLLLWSRAPGAPSGESGQTEIVAKSETPETQPSTAPEQEPLGGVRAVAPEVVKTVAPAEAQAKNAPQTVSVIQFAPTAEQFREEIAQDPESPSQTMLEFSVRLEKKLQAALRSPEDSAALFGELDPCAANQAPQRVADSARAICLSDAARISERYPELKARYENLELRLEPRIVSLKKAMDLR